MTSIFNMNSEDDKNLLDLVSQSLQQPKVAIGDKPVAPPSSDVNNAQTLADIVKAIRYPQEPTTPLTPDQQNYVDGLSDDENNS